jgi:hypothetical protein
MNNQVLLAVFGSGFGFRVPIPNGLNCPPARRLTL